MAKTQKGFTLIEIIVVITVIIVLAIGGMNAASFLIGSTDANTTAHNISTALETARNYTLNHYNGSSNYGVYFTSSSYIIYAGTTYSTSDFQVSNTTLPADTSLQSISFGGNSYIYFQSVKGTPSTSGSLKVNTPRSIYYIIVNGTGAVTIQLSAPTTIPTPS